MRRLIFLSALALLLLAACKPRIASSGPDYTPTPLPTSTARDFPVVVSPACQAAEYGALRTRQPQGDLIAWDPNTNRLAFAGPGLNSNWFSGQLYLTGPDFKNAVALAPNVLVFGDLTWSPDGSKLAFVAFRQPDTYTIMTVNPASGNTTDLFNTQDARTDSYAGSKAIVAWRNATTLRVLTSCGDDCDQTLEIDTAGGQITPVGEQLRLARDRLFPRPLEKPFNETAFPPDMMTATPGGSILSIAQMKAPDWTTDGKKAVYIDSDLYAWVILTDEKVQYQLETPNVNVQEAKWAPDGRFLAVRTDDNVLVFDTGCNPIKK